MNLNSKSFKVYGYAGERSAQRYMRDNLYGMARDEDLTRVVEKGENLFWIVVLTASEYQELKKLERRNK